MKTTSLALLASLLITTVPAAGQEPGALPGVFGEVLDVRVVNLEVVVTDRDGVQVRGLKPEDFRLIVDGEPVAIDYFSEIRGGVAAEPADDVQVPGVGALVAGEPVGTSYLLFIDDFFTVAADRDRTLERIAGDLPLLGPQDRMAVVAYDGDDLEMLTTWSQSPAELARVLNDARTRPARGLQRLAERRQFKVGDDLLERLEIVPELVGGGSLNTQLSPDERYYVQRLAEQLDRTVAAAAATLRSFAQPPGRKVMLLLSGGWPYLPTDYLLGEFGRAILDREGLEGDDLYGRLVDTANLLGYTLYPVDVPGFGRDLLRTGEQVAAASAPTAAGSSELLREQELHYTLHRLAEKTGGRAFINTARDRALSGVVSDTRTYYWLGFTPARAWDDQRHEVRVEVTSPGYRVRARDGYLDSSRSREVTMAVESALLFGNPPGEGELQVSVGEARRARRNRMEVPLQVRVPLDQVTFLPAGGGQATELELRIAVRDERGRRAEIPVVPLRLEAGADPESGQVARYETTLLLRRLPHEAVVAVFDPASGRILSSGVKIAP